MSPKRFRADFIFLKALFYRTSDRLLAITSREECCNFCCFKVDFDGDESLLGTFYLSFLLSNHAEYRIFHLMHFLRAERSVFNCERERENFANGHANRERRVCASSGMSYAKGARCT